MRAPLFHVLALLLVLVSLNSFHAFGALVRKVGTNELVAASQTIFEGEVVSKESFFGQNGNIYTKVEFVVFDILKGDNAAAESLTLTFTGGQVGDIAMTVGAEIPEVAERGIFFVERLEGQINPLLGWSQGKFTVNNDDTIKAANNELIVGMEGRQSPQNLTTSNGVADGIITMKEEEVREEALLSGSKVTLTVEEFKSKIRELGRR